MPASNGDKPENLATAVTEVSERVTLLIREEIELARAEVTQKISTLSKGLVAGAIGAVFGLLAIPFLLLTVAWGLNSLLSSSFKIGGDASIAAGPVGAGAKSTVTADLISFSRAKGVYGGVNLDGTVVHTNVRWNDVYYGKANLLPPEPEAITFLCGGWRDEPPKGSLAQAELSGARQISVDC